MLVNYALNEYRVASMEFVKESTEIDNCREDYNKLNCAKSNKFIFKDKCVVTIVWFTIILICVSSLALILLAVINGRNSNTIDKNDEEKQNTDNSGNPATNQPKPEPTSENGSN